MRRPFPGALCATAIAAALFTSSVAFADPAKTVAVRSDGAGLLEVLYVSPSGPLLRKHQDGASWDPAVQVAPGPVSAVTLALNCPTAVTPGTLCPNVGGSPAGRLEAFFIGPSQQMFHAYETVAGSGTWAAAVPFFGTAKNLVAGQNADGRLEVFWVGLDNWIYHAWQTAPNGGTWGVGALTASGQGGPTVDPTWSELTLAQDANGKFDLYYAAPGTFDLWRMTQLAPNAGWASPAAVSGDTAAHAAASRNADGRIELFFSNASGLLTHRWQTGANLESWSDGVFGESAGFITALADANGRLDVISTAAAPEGDLMLRSENYPDGIPPDGGSPLPSWSSSSQFGWGTVSVAAAQTSDHRIEVMYVRDDGALYHDYQLDPGEYWSGEYPLPDAPWPAPFSVGAFTPVLTSFQSSLQWSVNDHSFARGPDGRWRMFGIVAPNPDANYDVLVPNGLDWMGYAVGTSTLLAQDSFAYTAASNCGGPTPTNLSTFFPAAFCEPFTGSSNQVLWAPHVIAYGGRYMMFYAAGDRDPSDLDDPTAWSIEVRTSSDLTNWSAPVVPPALVDSGYQARDPMVFQDPVTGDWIMYVTSTEDGAVASNYVVKACSPTDATLFDWGPCSVVYVDFHVGKTYGPTESPFVVARTNGGVTAYYLFIGPRPYDPPGNPPYNWQEPGYLGTDVFRSLDPRHWDNAQYIGHIAAHAAEVIQDGAQYYVSSAGTDQGVNALNVAPLTWLNGY